MRPTSSLPLLCFVSLTACSAATKDPVGGAPLGPDAAADTAVEAAELDSDLTPAEDTDPGFNTDVAPPIDPDKDNDGDGYVFKDDCNDKDPLVNPGAYDVLGDGVDNDCNGTVDDPESGCDTSSLKLDTKSAQDLAKALGICAVADPIAEGKDKRWGLVSARMIHADGSVATDNLQWGVMKQFGPNVKPKQGSNLVALSSGAARTPDQPGYVRPISPSYKTGSSVTPPAGWPKATSGCPTPLDGKANDSVALEMRVRVPTNAKSFSYDFDFYSSEYITFVCSSFNDSFVAMLRTDGKTDNISFDSMKNPINVNSGFFEVCTPGTKSGKSFACAKGTNELQGTGFWDDSDPTENGATSWLRTKAPVVPGEIITIQFMIWDTSDHILDSTILIDNWMWDATGSTAPSTDRPPS
jgi:hypothetical protein